jgi:ATP-dependent protease Clp ATPase subunit
MQEVDDRAKRCSFYRKNAASVSYLITAPRASICDECVLLSMEILVQERLVGRASLLRFFFSW